MPTGVILSTPSKKLLVHPSSGSLIVENNPWKPEVLRIKESFAFTSPEEFTAKVFDLMREHGIDAVRGGAYLKLEFTSSQLSLLKEKIKPKEEGHCIFCGKINYHSSVCSFSPSPKPSSPKDKCLRCGRGGHWAKTCYAKKHSKGYILKDGKAKWNERAKFRLRAADP